MVKKINEDQFDEVKASDTAVVDFSATWCGPCKMMAPVLEGLSEELGGQVSFFNIDVDDNPGIAEEYGVQSIPNLVLLKKGVKVSDSIGFKPAEALKDWINGNLG